MGQLRLGSQPFQHSETVHAGHFEVQQDQVRRGVGFQQILDGLFTIEHMVDRRNKSGFGKGLAQQEDIIPAVVGDEDSCWLFHV